MISTATRTLKRYCREPIENIKGYAEAVADTTKVWDCHHINEQWWSKAELKFIGMYYHRPASELVFLTRSEHRKQKHKGREGIVFTTKGRKHTEDEKTRISSSQKGEKGYWYGKKMSAETRAKMSESQRRRRRCR